MTRLSDEIDRRDAVFGKALFWLRLARGIPSLLMADRLYRERVRPDAPQMEFGGPLSRYERGVVRPGARRLLEILAVYGAGFADLETALDVMVRARKSLPALKRSLAPGTAFRQRVEAVVSRDALGEGDVRDVAIDLAKQALER